MARHDVHRIDGLDGYLLDCQADILDMMKHALWFRSCPKRTSPIRQPAQCRVRNRRERFVMATQGAATVGTRELGPPVTSLAAQNDMILAALDMLMTGY